MSNEINNHLLILESEKQQAELRLKDQIKSIRYILDTLENKLDNNQALYKYDGLQGNGVHLDTYISEIATYEKAIERFKAFLNNN